MIDSRNLSDLLPVVQRAAIIAIADAELKTGLKLIVTCTYRDNQMQAVLYAQGRTTPGKIVTNDPGPGGPHSLRVALDIAPAVKDLGGKVTLVYDTPLWPQISQCFKNQGFEWGGDWHSIKDKPHFQFTVFQTLAEIRAGAPVTDHH